MTAEEQVQRGVGRKAKTERLGVVRIDVNGRKRIRAWHCGLDARNPVHGTVPQKHPSSLLHPLLDE
jgi:hypothetical protein